MVVKLIYVSIDMLMVICFLYHMFYIRNKNFDENFKF